MRSITACLAILAGVLGCSDSKSPTGHAHANAAGLVVTANGVEVSEHIPLTSGETTRLELKLLDDHGAEITATDHLQVSLSWSPADLASATAVSGTNVAFDVTTAKPASTTGFLNVSVYHPHDETTKNLGSLHVQVE